MTDSFQGFMVNLASRSSKEFVENDVKAALFCLILQINSKYLLTTPKLLFIVAGINKEIVAHA